MEKIIQQPIETDMKDSYLDYAMSVIVGRALPDARDGLKPVHRRVLYAMHELSNNHNKPHKKSARIVGDCFIEGTLLLTEKGLIEIQEIELGDRVYTQKGKNKVTHLYEMPEKKLLSITLENGISNIVTPNQKFKVLTKDLSFEWKDAKDLTNKDFILIKSQYPDIKKEAYLGSFNKKKIFFDEDIAYLLGQLLSDGWVEKKCARGYPFRCGFCSSSIEIIHRVQKIIFGVFNYQSSIQKRKKEYQNSKGQKTTSELYQLRINSGEINQFLVETFSLKNAYAKTKIIPHQVFASPKKVIMAFVSGLIDGDGSIHKNRMIIHYGSISNKLINQLQILLQHLGIFSYKYMDKSSNNLILGREIKNTNNFYYLEIESHFAYLLSKELNLSEPRKKERISLFNYSNVKPNKFERIPFSSRIIFKELSENHIGAGWYIDKKGNKFRKGIKYPNGCKIRYSKNIADNELCRTQILDWGIFEKLEKINSPNYQIIKNILDNNLYFLKVKSINCTTCEKTFDIQVENEHEFVANGMVSHNCLGKYHPHGDVAIYDSLVRMAQTFSLRYPLVDGHGNFGSIDGDSAASMRYTEVRMNQIAEEMLFDLEKETVKFIPNFDETLKEPVVLPSKIPNLLINGSSGIAVGMATNIPPYNLIEICDALIGIIDGISEDLILSKIQGPDFPTGGIIVGRGGILSAHKTGRGKIKLRSKTEIDDEKNHIIVTEIPYQITKTSIIESIVSGVKEERIQGIRGVHDHSDKEGIRLVIEVKRGEDPNVVLNQLYKHSPLETTFGIINLVLVGNEPKLLNMYSLLDEFLSFRKEIVTKRCMFDLKKAQDRAHVLEGLKIAIENIDDIVPLLKNSKNIEDAKNSLMKNYSLSEVQSKSILEMKISKLVSLERQKLIDEFNSLLKTILELKEILADDKKIFAIIKTELSEISARYGDFRRTEIIEGEDDLDFEDLIPNEETVIMITNRGYIKRVPLEEYKSQKRGGVGVIGIETKEQDDIDDILITKTHNYLLFFTDKGKIHWLKTYRIPEAGRYSAGKAIVNLLELSDNSEKITSWVSVKEFNENEYLSMITKNGIIKRSSLMDYSNPRKGGIIGINLRENDQLVSVLKTTGKESILIATKNGLAIRFDELDAREIGRTGMGVIGIRFKENDYVVSATICNKPAILTITENGYGKRTPIDEYRIQGRGGHGVINIKTEGRNGKVIGAKAVEDTDQVIVISSKGQVIRTSVSNISQVGRNTMGVKILRLKEGEMVANFAVIKSELIKDEIKEEKIEELPDSTENN